MRSTSSGSVNGSIKSLMYVYNDEKNFRPCHVHDMSITPSCCALLQPPPPLNGEIGGKGIASNNLQGRPGGGWGCGPLKPGEIRYVYCYDIFISNNPPPSAPQVDSWLSPCCAFTNFTIQEGGGGFKWWWNIYPSTCISIYLPIYLPVYLSIYLSIYPSIYLSIYLSICHPYMYII